MRILHTSDWHLGRSFYGADLLPAQRRFADHLVATVEREGIGAVIVAGDVYDRAVPGHDAMELYDATVTRLLAAGAQLIVTSGNHDSFMRLGVGRRQLDAAGLHLRTRLSDIERPVVLADGAIAAYGIPYLEPGLVCERFGTARTHTAVLAAAMDRIREHRARHHPDAALLVAAHAFVAGAVASESERPIEIGGVGAAAASVFAGTDYAALGHLHRPQSVAPGVRYAGSPVPLSFGEAQTGKEYVLLDVAEAPGQRDRRVRESALPLPPFESVATVRGTLAEVIAQADECADALVSAELTDEARVPGALARLRAAFPRLVRFDWVRLAAPQAPAEPAPGAAAVPTDAEVFDDFVRTVAQRSPSPGEQRRFAAALDAALREDA
ncbi:exonuclease subunit SbcD [Brevibacterium sp. 5221]|uniref:Nuclease SbcCD subunit D n=1 Tax=Brevibacterium rongguiense TaxID=2695267 RepID=A0A6N9HAL3_9MICO|nr:exonuclease SbcCD subunit D [Brevibacterium rongguiense]MYM20836.1 exonuclease subunit SbcD [Brevibacterium rongguiense]